MDTVEKQNKISEYLDAGNFKAASIHLRSLTKFLKKFNTTDYSDYWANLVLLARIQLRELDDPPAAEATLLEAVDFFRETVTAPTAHCLESMTSAIMMLGEIFEDSGRNKEANDIYNYLLNIYEKTANQDHPMVTTLNESIERVS